MEHRAYNNSLQQNSDFYWWQFYYRIAVVSWTFNILLEIRRKQAHSEGADIENDISPKSSSMLSLPFLERGCSRVGTSQSAPAEQFILWRTSQKEGKVHVLSTKKMIVL